MTSNSTTHVFSPDDCERIVIEPGSDKGYPPGFPDVLQGRALRRLSGKVGLRNLAIVLVELEPGSALSLRLWQSHEEEFFYVLEGEATLITDDGEERMPAGSCAGFPVDRPDGHQLINKSDRIVRLLEMADIVPGNETTYSDHDLRAIEVDGRRVFVNRNGERYL